MTRKKKKLYHNDTGGELNSDRGRESPAPYLLAREIDMIAVKKIYSKDHPKNPYFEIFPTFLMSKCQLLKWKILLIAFHTMNFVNSILIYIK